MLGVLDRNVGLNMFRKGERDNAALKGEQRAPLYPQGWSGCAVPVSSEQQRRSLFEDEMGLTFFQEFMDYCYCQSCDV